MVSNSRTNDLQLEFRSPCVLESSMEQEVVRSERFLHDSV